MAIQRLVSGLPMDIERERHFVVLQVCIDDSGTGRGQQPWFILAGYLTRVRNWKGFADDWQKVLRGPPKLRYIKAQEAYRGTDQFASLTWLERDKRMLACKALIEKYVTKRVSFSVPYEGYDLAFRAATVKYGVFADELENPYTFALASLVAQVISDRMVSRKPHEKIEFVFDCGFEDRERLKNGYARMMEIFTHNFPKHICDLVAREPLFRSDEEFLPLQAADIAAWGTRRRHNKLRLPDWYPKLDDKPNIDIEYTAEELREMYS